MKGLAFFPDLLMTETVSTVNTALYCKPKKVPPVRPTSIGKERLVKGQLDQRKNSSK